MDSPNHIFRLLRNKLQTSAVMHGSFEVREDAARDICACGASVRGRDKQRASACEVREGVANNVRVCVRGA